MRTARLVRPPRTVWRTGLPVSPVPVTSGPAFSSISGGRLVLLAVALLLCRQTNAWTTAKHDVMVLVLTRRHGPDQVAISYSHVVNHSRLTAAVAALSRDRGVAVGELSIREEPELRGSQTMVTSAKFVADGLASGGSGRLPVLAIARALPDWRHMRLVFVLGGESVITGPETSDQGGYRIRLIGNSAGYQYDVERMEGEQPAHGTDKGERAREPALDRTASRLWETARIALIALSGAAACAAAWILVQSFRRGS